MSVRKLTNVQEARRILRERRARCSAETIAQVTGRFPSFARAKPRLIRELLLTAQRKGEAVQLGVYPSGGAMYFVARRLRDGRIKFAAGSGATVEHARAYAQRDLERLSTAAQRGYYWSAYFPKPRRCPCTPRELVAIDTLLETGDKYAEYLAKRCKRGGGVLEGSRRHRRNR